MTTVETLRAAPGLPGSPMREILELARWAPSGDNTQPWWFEPLADDRLRVHGFDTREHCVYDLDGRASRISIGALIETIRIAASSFGLRVVVDRDEGAPENEPVFDLRFVPDPATKADALASCIESRSVQRRALSTRPLTGAEKAALGNAVGAGCEIVWLETLADRWRAASLMFRSAHIRLSIEEAYRVHAAVIEWNATHSIDRMPDAAVGLDPLSLVAMRWAMRSWPRTRFVSRWLGGTIAPRLQLDLVPGVRCAAHVAFVARSRASSLDDFATGAAVQRFWLTAEQLGLRHQPEITPLVFARYADERRRFARDERALREAEAVRDELDRLLGADRRARTVWIGRIGAGAPARARSLRLPLEALLAPRAGVSRASSCSPS